MSFEELFVSDFPLYSVLAFGKGEFCVTGGGGKSKTGVPNVIVSILAYATARLRTYDQFDTIIPVLGDPCIEGRWGRYFRVKVHIPT